MTTEQSVQEEIQDLNDRIAELTSAADSYKDQAMKSEREVLLLKAAVNEANQRAKAALVEAQTARADKLEAQRERAKAVEEMEAALENAVTDTHLEQRVEFVRIREALKSVQGIIKPFIENS